ncbi:MAG: PadR family transcriptional regulator [Clostridiales bacterium]|nr:PadR family transcriptional regulator [Clostridiales bacterium]
MKKKTRFVILGLLRDTCMTGYELKHYIDLRMSFFWQESYGQLYPELTAMIQEGLLSTQQAKVSGREKIQYSITALGQEVFNQWMTEENEKETIRNETLLKFFLADDHNKVDVRKHLETYRSQSIERLELYHKFRESLNGYEGIHNHFYIIHMLELGMRQQELYIDWSTKYLCDLEIREQKEKSAKEKGEEA